MRSRAAVIAVASMLLLALQPAQAAACNDPEIGGPESARAGAVVSYTVSNLQPGAEYVIYLDDIATGVVDAGVSESETFTGTFRMPDRDVALTLHATHVVEEEHDPTKPRHPPGPYYHKDTIKLEAPAAASAPAVKGNVNAAPVEAAQPAAVSTAAEQSGPGVTTAVRRPSVAPRPGARNGRATPTAPAAAPAGADRPASAPATAARVATDLATPAGPLAVPDAGSRAVKRPASSASRPAAGEAPTGAPFSDAATRTPAVTLVARSPEPRPAEARVGLIAVLTLLLAHLGVSLVRMRRPVPPLAPPVPPTVLADEIERELQEIIAEEQRRVRARA